MIFLVSSFSPRSYIAVMADKKRSRNPTDAPAMQHFEWRSSDDDATAYASMHAPVDAQIRAPINAPMRAPALTPATSWGKTPEIKMELGSKAIISDRLTKIGEELLSLSMPSATALTVEYLRFMHLKTAHDIDGRPSTMSPSPDIDELWHKHLTDTRSYEMMERLLLSGGGRIHHNPFTQEQPGSAERLQNTLMRYEGYFHAVPPSDICGLKYAIGVTEIVRKNVC